MGTGSVSPCWDLTPVLPISSSSRFKLAPNFHNYVTLCVLLPLLLEVLAQAQRNVSGVMGEGLSTVPKKHQSSPAICRRG